ncbi:MAG: hypothetical protein K2H53_05485 [Clostridia bacterium]|nr:hypothetical protein [Clostridia bacterium]
MDKTLLKLLNHNEYQSGVVALGNNIKYEILDTSVAIVNEEGKISAISEGETKVKIIDTQNRVSTYIYIEVRNSEIDVQAGKNFTVSLKQNGTVWTYGTNANGELGLGDNENKNKPVQIQTISNVKQIATGYSHTIALTEAGEIYTWGLGTNRTTR